MVISAASVARRYWFLPVPALFYFLTAAPGIGHADQAILIDEMFHGTLGSDATHHNLTVLAGYVAIHAFPFGEIAYRCNLVSVVFGALAVALFYLLVLRVTERVQLAAFSATFLMVSHSLWWHSTIAEVYAVNAFFCAAILLCLAAFEQTRRAPWLQTAALLAGLAVFNHAQMGFWAPALLVFGWRAHPGTLTARARAVLRTFLWYGAGLLPYVAVFIREAVRGNAGRVAAEAAGGEFSRLFMTIWPPRVLLDQLAQTSELFLLQWGWPSIVLLYIVLGVRPFLADQKRRALHGAIVVGFGINTLFFAFYPTWDKYAFLMPSFMLLTYVGALGLKWLWSGPLGHRPWLAVLLSTVNAFFCAYPVYFFARLPRLAGQSAMWSRYRDDPRARTAMFDGPFLANPNKRTYRTIDRFCRLVLQRLPPDALVIDQIARTYFQLTYYFQQFYFGPRPTIVLFVPTGFDLSKWPHGVTAERAVALVRQAASLDKVFLSSIYGSDEIVRPLLERDITFVEYPLAQDLGLHQAVAASQLDMGSWVDRVEVGVDQAVLTGPTSVAPRFTREQAPSVAIWMRLRRRNPPMRVSLQWVDSAHGEVVHGPTLALPFDVAPVVIRPPGGRWLGAGRWRVEVRSFEQLVSSPSFEIE